MPADAPPTFSESWYRIARQKIYLRPGVRVRRQNYRGERWFVLENPFSNQYFRLRPAAYEFVARLAPDRTVEQVWQDCLNKFPDEAPGQEAVLQLLAQLYYANLIQYDHASDTAKLFERYERVRQREKRFMWLNLMFMRFPLLDPNQFLNRTIGFVGKLISPIGALIWAAVVIFGLKVVADNFTSLKDQSQGVLAPDNLFLLYVAMVIVKTLHEFGHAYFCKRFGGEVHVMGVMLMIFTPLPYMDASSAWGFRNRWHRVLVGAAGVIVELFVAGIAAWVWAKTGPGTLHSLAYNMMFVASVSTIIFNLNPLLRYDGYYILTDLIEMPNLQQKCQQFLYYLAERHLFGLKKVDSPAQNKREAAWFAGYGIPSTFYRFLVFGGIILFVADQFLLAGIIMAVICIVSWIIVPICKLVLYLATSPKLDRQRSRAIGATLAVVGVFVLLLQIIPFPHHFRAPGVIRAKQFKEIVAETAGRVESLVARSGSTVTNGQPLVQLTSSELDIALAGARASVVETRARLTQAMKEDAASLRPLESKLASVQARLAQLETDKANLLIRAPLAGIFISPQSEEFIGRWVPKGGALGMVVNPAGFEFFATVAQADGDRVFTGAAPKGEMMLKGQAGKELPLANIKVVPAEQQYLPSAALSWMAGGEVATAPDDPQGRKAAEPFFEVRGDVEQAQTAAEVMLLHGRSGQARFDLKAEPLLPRWIRRLRQLLQKRYQV